MNYFVGEDVVQTLTNKRFDRIRGSVTPTIRKENGAGLNGGPGYNNGTVGVAAGSTTLAGRIIVTTGASTPSPGQTPIVQVGLNSTDYSTPTFVTVTPANPVTAGIPIYVTGASLAEFYLGTTGQLATLTKYEWFYHVVG